MSVTAVVSVDRIHGLLERIENDPHSCRKRFMMELRHARLCVEAGAIFQCDHGSLTVLCVVDPEIWYFQGGLVYFANKRDFLNLIKRSARAAMNGVMGGPGVRPLTRMEVELILGIVSVVGPLGFWTVVGDDLMEFLGKNREKIDQWILRTASLLLARMVLKKYAERLYRKVSAALAEGVWSNLSNVVVADDAFIARFTGKLLGTYRSDAVMDRAISMRWSLFSCILKGLEVLVNIGSGMDDRSDDGSGSSIDDFVKSLRQLGVNMSVGEIHSLLHVEHCNPYEIQNAIGILNAAHT